MHGLRVREGGSGMAMEEKNTVAGTSRIRGNRNRVDVLEQQSLNKFLKSNTIAFKKIERLFSNFDKNIETMMGDVSKTFNETSEAIIKAVTKPEKKVNLLASCFKKLGGVLLDVQNIQKGMEIADKYLNTSYRLNQANIDKVDSKSFQNSVFQSANRSRVSYDAMANSMANLGSGAKDSFANNNELIAFTELAYKSFGGAGEQGQQTGVDTLIQAMSSGGLKGSELSNIAQTSPALIAALEGYTGKSQEDLMNMADQGLITAAVIKNAMFESSESINKEFGNTPKTFADVFDEIKSKALLTFGPAIEQIGTILQSQGFEQFIGSVMFVIDVVSRLFSILVGMFDHIFQMWGTLEPILLSIGIILTMWAVTQIPLLIKDLWGMIKPIWAAAAGWLAQYWWMALLLVIIGLILYAIIKFGDTVINVIAMTYGVLWALWAMIQNVIIDAVNLFNNAAVAVENFFNNVMFNIKKGFYDFIINMLSGLLDFARKGETFINALFGSKIEISAGIEAMLKSKEEQRKNLEENRTTKQYQEKEKVNVLEAFMNGWTIGEEKGSSIVQKVQNGYSTLMNITNMGPGTDPTQDLISEKVLDNGAMPVTPKDGSLNVDMSGEDLKYLKDIAEREYINQYSTATLAPSLNVSFGNVTKEADVDKLVGRIQKILNEELAVVSEGVY